MDRRMDVRTYGQPERSMPPAGRGRGGIKQQQQKYKKNPFIRPTSFFRSPNTSLVALLGPESSYTNP